MTSVTLNVMIMSAFAMIVIVCGNPVDSNVESEIIICPEGVTNGVMDTVVIFPRELRCSMVGGLCVESDKCRSLVSAKGLCPINQYQGVECCFEAEPQYSPCQRA